MKKWPIAIILMGMLAVTMMPKARADDDDLGAGVLGFALGTIVAPPTVVYRSPPAVIYEAPPRYEGPPVRRYYYGYRRRDDDYHSHWHHWRRWHHHYDHDHRRHHFREHDDH